MAKYPFLITITLACVSSLAHAEEARYSMPLPSHTPEGRFGTKCYSSERDANGGLCIVSFYKLIALPEKYDRRLVMITGYLRDVFGRPVLFPSRESYESGVEEEGIALIGAKFPPDIAAKRGNGVWPVLVIGRFDAKFIDGGRLGALYQIQEVQMAGKNGQRANGPPSE